MVVVDPPVLVDPLPLVDPLVVVEMTTMPPPPLLPPKNPPKNPPPKPKPPEPPITVTSLPPPWGVGISGRDGKATAIGTMANCCCIGVAQGTVRLMTRRACLTVNLAQETVRMIRRFSTRGLDCTAVRTLACLTYWT